MTLVNITVCVNGICEFVHLMHTASNIYSALRHGGLLYANVFTVAEQKQ